ncbi:MAG: hypothetical protein AB7W37_06515 [Syntrophobacteraceae bacterium]
MEEFLKGAKAEEFHKAWESLPVEVQAYMDEYLHLFAPELKQMGIARASRIVMEVAELVGSGTVRVPGEAPRPAPPEVWSEAMKRTISGVRRKGGRLENHNYLCKAAFGVALPGAVREERGTGSAYRGWSDPKPPPVSPPRTAPPPKVEEPDPVTEEDREALKRMLAEFNRKFGGPPREEAARVPSREEVKAAEAEIAEFRRNKGLKPIREDK